MKNKPFLTASLIFGIVGIALLTIAGVSFMANSTLISDAVSSFLHVDSKSLSNAVIAELGVVFLVPSFIFAYRSILDVEYYEKKYSEFAKISENTVTETEENPVSENSPTIERTSV